MPLYTIISPDLNDKIITKIAPDARDIDWLCDDYACDFFCDSELNLPHNDYDIFRHDNPQNRRKKMIVCDMDSTILDQETLDDMAAVLPHDIQEKIAAITLKTMHGEIDFIQSIKIRVSCFGGLPTKIIDDVAKNLNYMRGAKTLIATMKKHGALSILISGGFTDITSIVRDECGFDYDFANQFEKKNDKLTGELHGDIIDGNAKARILKEIHVEHKIAVADVMAVGDGSNDVAMIQAAGYGVAFHAKPLLKKATKNQINHTDLTSLLYIQGYRKSEFVTA